ncbi:MAG: sugar ABC transporter ATP-binding protein [Deltaproteobacteria bacterium]|nr:sugar ABC transporter ATP-binding protein [Deltaproteobacteria bacterium]
MPDPALKLVNITKKFPGVLALDRVCFELMPGEVHVLFGENGAGKSTLTKIIAGSYPPDEGEIFVHGSKVAFQSPHDARIMGISAVYQEFSLVPQLTVMENLFLGREMVKNGLLDKESMRKKAEELLKGLDFDLDLTARVADLSRAERQMVEIAKAFQEKMSVLILDEPTASLTDKEVTKLFEIIRKLKSERVGIVYISHRMNELKKIGDRITVFRDGKYVATLKMAEADEKKLISLMTGREYAEIFPSITHTPGKPVLTVQGLTTASGIRDVSFTVREGEIFGIAGLVGAGKSRVGRAIFGLEKITAGSSLLFDRPLERITPSKAIKSGILYFPADRHKEGLVLCRSVRENQTLAAVPLFERGLFIDAGREKSTVRGLIERLKIRPPHVDQTVNDLSGGNQQKVMLARGLTRDIKVFIFDEASCGIDVGAKRDVYRLLRDYAEKGAAVIFISSELPEILNLCHTVMVMHAGSACSIMPGSEATEEKILTSCFGCDYAGFATRYEVQSGVCGPAIAADALSQVQ